MNRAVFVWLAACGMPRAAAFWFLMAAYSSLVHHPKQ